MPKPRTSSVNRAVRGYPSVRKESQHKPVSESARTGHRDGMGRDGRGSSFPVVPAGVEQTARATEKWTLVRDRLGEMLYVPQLMFVDGLTLAGEVDDCLVLTGPEWAVGWVRRQFAAIIGDLCREHGLSGVRICVNE